MAALSVSLNLPVSLWVHSISEHTQLVRCTGDWKMQWMCKTGLCFMVMPGEPVSHLKDVSYKVGPVNSLRAILTDLHHRKMWTLKYLYKTFGQLSVLWNTMCNKFIIRQFVPCAAKCHPPLNTNRGANSVLHHFKHAGLKDHECYFYFDDLMSPWNSLIQLHTYISVPHFIDAICIYTHMGIWV